MIRFYFPSIIYNKPITNPSHVTELQRRQYLFGFFLVLLFDNFYNDFTSTVKCVLLVIFFCIKFTRSKSNRIDVRQPARPLCRGCQMFPVMSSCIRVAEAGPCHVTFGCCVHPLDQ